MNILVSCPLCSRQYRAQENQIGKKYYCHCGTVVIVPDPKTAHESRVIRCSSCGAPREEQADRCSSCHSDFTLHEQDLDTVCPECLARISGSARYCHHCGIRISAINVVAQETSTPCPVCQMRPLQYRQASAENLSFAECEVCAGLWLSKDVFDQALKRARDRGMDENLASLFPRTYTLTSEENTTHRGPFYRKCPSCRELMTRKLFPGTPVIIDLCPVHGLWFDSGELEKILGLVRQGLPPRKAASLTGQSSLPMSGPQNIVLTPREDFSFVRNLLDHLLSKVLG